MLIEFTPARARTRTVVKNVDNMTPEEFKRCRSLSFREGGNLWFDLYKYYKKKSCESGEPFITPKTPAKVIMVKDQGGQILSWCLMTPEKGRHNDRYVAQFYTRKSCRGRGYGTRLMRAALKIDPKPYVYPHDPAAAGLFKKHKQSVRYDQRVWSYRKEMSQ